MRRSIPLTAAAAVAVAIGATTAVAAPATAAPKAPSSGPPTVLAEHLVGPLTFDLSADGVITVGQSFLGEVTRIAGGSSETLSQGPDSTGVSVLGPTVTWSERAGDEQTIEGSWLKSSGPAGDTSIDLLAWEQANNPDGDSWYGFEEISDECAATLPPFVNPRYQGLVDTHAYGTLALPGVTYVADSGMNAVLKVVGDEVSTVAVLPPQPLVVTDEMRVVGEVEGQPIVLDECVVGLTYDAEPVPTDVEMGTDGMLYVSTLPGAPGLGFPYGSVYRVDPVSGDSALVATGFAGATGLAVAPNGTVYVSQMFGGKVSAITRDGSVSTFAEVDSPAGVEWQSGKVVVSAGVFGDGRIVSYPVRGR
ncbi:ScyD/ScyE family protein [Agromyces sp. H3Y2-19a]|uniref:ScyD/ScyE family protein n=1 Tax=Agromyces chromiiresistens TaxID=3030835 RepID=UPI0023B90A4C|nr:ScyD/ScyE family protein [Agromyces chromiiresistens]MDF0515500.1 ScyD/ScyE family protein [Agromyces chromiiresistens]